MVLGIRGRLNCRAMKALGLSARLRSGLLASVNSAGLWPEGSKGAEGQRKASLGYIWGKKQAP
jgi:hypothetical protein